MTLRIAMWSGPRNVSTALMRAFGSRPDTVVCDEPLYAHYLKTTGLPHPLAARIVREHEADWRKVVAWLTGPLPEGKSVFYQKHMAHHLTPDVDRAWLDELENVFLIREPRAMLTSLLEKLDDPGLLDTALPQQVELFERQRDRTGETPVVIDSRELLTDPPAILARLCEHVGLAYSSDMLSWEPGLHPSDGVWAEYWYGNALASTGFAPYRAKHASVPPAKEELAQQCDELYARLAPYRLTA